MLCRLVFQRNYQKIPKHTIFKELLNPILGEGGQFDHSIIYSVTIFLAQGPGSQEFLTLLLNIKVSTW